MDENAKNEMRNYVSAAGFFAFVLSTLFVCVQFVAAQLFLYPPAGINMVYAICSILLILAGVLLAVLGKRDVTALAFLALGSIKLLLTLNGSIGLATENLLSLAFINIILMAFLAIQALILLTAKDTVKYPLALLIGLEAVATGAGYLLPFEISVPALLISHAVIGVLALYYAFACASERIILPLGRTFSADQETDFKKSASSLGYLTVGASMAVWAVYHLFGASEAVSTIIYALDGVYALLLILISILLFAVAKMRFTPVMFLLAGFLLAVSSVIGANAEFILGILFIVLGLFAVLRTDSRILPGLMFAVYGISYFISPLAAGAGITILAVIVNGLPALIALYLAVATFSQKKLPLF